MRLQNLAKAQDVDFLALWCAPFHDAEAGAQFSKLHRHRPSAPRVAVAKVDRVKLLLGAHQPLMPVRLHLAVFLTLLPAGDHVEPLPLQREVQHTPNIAVKRTCRLRRFAPSRHSAYLRR